jgi:hypothetical protein
VRFTKSWGFRLLALWLIVHGLIVLTGKTFENSNLVLGALAVAAGVLIFIDR